MDREVPVNSILFLDIETVPMRERMEDLPEPFRKLWEKKAENILKQEELTAGEKFGRAGIYAEFGKIVCISVGFFPDRGEFRLKSFYGDDEQALLEAFITSLRDMESYMRKNHKQLVLCAHNGKEFDFPYLARRMLILGLKIPDILNVAGKKPWEVPFLDTLEMWKFGDRKSFTSLELLAALFGIPTPKDDIDGSQVAEVYYKEKDLKRIARYCEKDVLTTARIYQRFVGMPSVKDEEVSWDVGGGEETP
jgi:predicted PolB exonuclease-like 3'-5' exonuclease